jgi:hypothetical protein
MPLDAEIKFRCEADLVARFARICMLERRKISDQARLVFEDYVAAQEHSMNLVLPTKSAPPEVKSSPPAPTRYPPPTPRHNALNETKRKK